MCCVEGQHCGVDDTVDIAQALPDHFRQLAYGCEESKVARLGTELVESLVEVTIEVGPGGFSGDDDGFPVDSLIVPQRRGSGAATVDTLPFNYWPFNYWPEPCSYRYITS